MAIASAVEPPPPHTHTLLTLPPPLFALPCVMQIQAVRHGDLPRFDGLLHAHRGQLVQLGVNDRSSLCMHCEGCSSVCDSSLGHSPLALLAFLLLLLYRAAPPLQVWLAFNELRLPVFRTAMRVYTEACDAPSGVSLVRRRSNHSNQR